MAEPGSGSGTKGPTSAQLRATIDRGETGDKVPVNDPAAVPPGTDEEAVGTPPRRADAGEALPKERRAHSHRRRSRFLRRP